MKRQLVQPLNYNNQYHSTSVFILFPNVLCNSWYCSSYYTRNSITIITQFSRVFHFNTFPVMIVVMLFVWYESIIGFEFETLTLIKQFCGKIWNIESSLMMLVRLLIHWNLVCIRNAIDFWFSDLWIGGMLFNWYGHWLLDIVTSLW